jgi:hypothetical protein
MRSIRTLLPAVAILGASLLGTPSAQAASSTLNIGADLVLIPPVLPTLPATKCPRLASVQVNGRQVAAVPTSSNVYGTCPIRGTVAVPYAPGTTVLYSATGSGVWPVFGFRKTVATPVVANS